MSRLPRPTHMRASSAAFLMGLLALSVLAPSQQMASASCAAPYLQPQVGALRPGMTVTVEGRGFTHGCQDSMGCPAFGCGSCEYDEPAPAPMQHVSLRLVQGDRTWHVGAADAVADENGGAGQVTWRFTVPADVEVGRARLIPGGGETLVVRTQ